MTGKFEKIHLFAKYNQDEGQTQVRDTVIELIELLSREQCSLKIEEYSASLIPDSELTKIPYPQLGRDADLVIVVGGDGSLLNASRMTVAHQVPILGINRGSLGFLADISPTQLEASLLPILAGEHRTENRTLLDASVKRNDALIYQQVALNDVVLYTGGLARMIEFEVWIDGLFVFKQRSDGLITSTPTGSTAYALSGGGPILYPTLAAIALVPMLPHALTSRPLVVSHTSIIELIIKQGSESSPCLSYDGQLHYELQAGDRVQIKRNEFDLKLIHPMNHNYYETLRHKLGWSTNWTSDRWSKS